MNYIPAYRRTTPDGFSEKGSKLVHHFINYEVLFELNEEYICDIGHIFRAKVKQVLLCIEFLYVGQWLDQVWTRWYGMDLLGTVWGKPEQG